MNTEFFEALTLFWKKRKGFPLITCWKRSRRQLPLLSNAIMVGAKTGWWRLTLKKENSRWAIRKTVVEAVENPNTEILLNDAYKYDKKAEIGSVVDIPLETKQFGRIAAQAAKHVIRQGIREAERGQMMQEFQSREHEIISAKVVRTDPARGSVTLEIGKSEAMLTRQEQVPGEELHEGDHVKVYVVEVAATDRGPRVMLSRTHPGLVKRLFEMEVPELYDGTVELKAISREAGSRTKIAVYSKDQNVDAVGACIGPKGARVAKIVDELGGEKIDVVKYSEDPAEFVAAALSPSQVVSVDVAEDGSKSCIVKVPDNQLSLAIGNKGQNARLAAKLTGWENRYQAGEWILTGEE